MTTYAEEMTLAFQRHLLGALLAECGDSTRQMFAMLFGDDELPEATLRTAIDWCYEELDRDARQTLRPIRLKVERYREFLRS